MSKRKKTKQPTQLEEIERRCVLSCRCGACVDAMAEDRENLRRRVSNVRADILDLISIAKGIVSSLEADLPPDDDECPF